WVLTGREEAATSDGSALQECRVVCCPGASGAVFRVSTIWAMHPRPELVEHDGTQALDLPETAPPRDPKAARRRRRRKVLLITLLVVALLGGVGLAGIGWYLHSVESSIERVQAFN